MGGKSRKTGGVSKALIDRLTSGGQSRSQKPKEQKEKQETAAQKVGFGLDKPK